jgi:hypothetical protein
MIEGDLRLTLDTKLQVANHPWDGLADLLQNFVPDEGFRVFPQFFVNFRKFGQ